MQFLDIEHELVPTKPKTRKRSRSTAWADINMFGLSRRGIPKDIKEPLCPTLLILLKLTVDLSHVNLLGGCRCEACTKPKSQLYETQRTGRRKT